VRRASAAALASEARVIPVLVGGARMPSEAELPGAIAPLALRNAVELQDRRWREDVDALVDVLEGRERGGVGNLPVQPTPFLGRERELGELMELLRRQDVRLLTLTGPGGIGKTRLAIQAAIKLAHTYPGGAWFVGLAPLTEPDLVLSEIARVLEVREAPEDQFASAIADRVARARTLIVLDNMEQLLPDAAAPIAQLSAAAPSLELVVSSREPLLISAEREFPVPILSEEDALALFVASARAADPSFAMSDGAVREAVAAICERLDRLPLAIELAAARTRLLEPAVLLQRLEQRLPLLTGGARDAPERQRTLRATIAWSVELLTEDERDLFERLAVFSGGWTLEAAEAVCDADLDTLQGLVQRNLVRQEGTRSTMLETIREFALERFEAGPDAEDVRHRHAAAFLELADGAHLGFEGSDQPRWIARLGIEYDNLRSALRWALDAGDDDLALRLVLGLSVLWYSRGPIAEGRRWVREALDRTLPVATEARAWALNWAGFLAAEQGARDEGAAFLTESIDCAREAHALAPQAISTSQLTGVLPPDRAGEMVPLAQEAVRLARGSGQDWVLGIALNNLGDSCREIGNDAAATAAFEESVAIRRMSGGDALTALPLINLAEMALLARDFERARIQASEALRHAVALGNQRLVALARSALGWSALADGAFDEATDRFRTALALMNELGYTTASISLLLGLAGAGAASGDVPRAARLEAAASRWEKSLGHVPTAADSGIHLRYLDDLRVATDPAVWEQEARAGRAMGLDEAIAYALGT
jgi:predicted ATPase